MRNHCAIQQKNAYAPREDMGMDYVVCPKPRRVGFFSSSIKPAGWHASHQADICDSKAGNELLDIILSKGGGQDAEQTHTHMASPPFFSGSPPSRVSNPLIQDARFVEEKQHAYITFSTHLQRPTLPVLNSGMSSSPSSRKGGLARNNFGNNPAVRIEGFEALDRDRRNCSISALA
uniref:Uncharacterized protein n=1 Tax=Kalanchoe fedtschenkoi TaxID=63787 RepID=A0A7N0U1G7_KALFE